MDIQTNTPPGFNPFPDDGTGYDTDVIVIGIGPAGGTAALALATYGVRVHAVTMFPWVANGPRAHITNQRAVEPFTPVQRVRLLGEAIGRYLATLDQKVLLIASGGSLS